MKNPIIPNKSMEEIRDLAFEQTKYSSITSNPTLQGIRATRKQPNSNPVGYSSILKECGIDEVREW